jgi:thiol-disulfide isomerase/thioredoxin
MRIVPILAAAALLPGCGGPARVAVEQVQVTPANSAEVLRAVRGAGARVVLVNVWATWCAPCREEFPDLVKLQRNYRDRGLRVIFVSADFDSELPAVKRFLAQHGVDWPTYLKAEADMEFISGLDERWTGAIPATFIYDDRGTLHHFIEGKVSYEQIERKVQDVLTKPKVPATVQG